MLLYTFIREFN